MKKSSNKVNNVTNKQPEVAPAETNKATNASTTTPSTLQTFSNSEFGNIRCITKDGEPWFVGKDVAEALGYKNGSRDINNHVEEDDRKIITNQNYQNGTFEIPTRGLTAINESGLYSLILSSKLPSAKKFKRWVTSEVLPAIRKTGGYVDENYNKTACITAILYI